MINVVVEVSGSGKTTVLRAIVEKLSLLGYRINLPPSDVRDREHAITVTKENINEQTA